jgi:hypothetical protein
MSVNPKNRFMTKKDFYNLTECPCGKKVFRYHNTSKNVFVARCSNFSDPKLKKKTEPCDLYCTYNDFRPVFTEIKNKIHSIKPRMEDPSKNLEERLKILFSFLFVSNHSSTLDEINILVKRNLKREPRKTFYFPTTALFNRISHLESFEDYRDRIFSKRIVDLDFIIPKQKENEVCFIPKDKLPSIFSTSLPEKKIESIKAKKTVKRIKPISNFIVVDENSDNYDSESEHSYDSDCSDKENSDYSDEDEGTVIEDTEDTPFEEPEEPEETDEYDYNEE